MRSICFLGLLLLLSWPLYAAQPTKLSALVIKPSRELTTLTFTLSQKTTGRVKYIPKPQQVTIDFANTTKNFMFYNARFVGSNVRTMSTATLGKDLRLILEVTTPVTWTIKFLPNDKYHNVVLEIDIISEPSKSTKKVLPPKTTTIKTKKPIIADFKRDIKQALLTEPAAIAIAKPIIKPSTLNPNTPSFTVVIDAGHGGKDPGAIGKRGSKEKDIVLAIAKKLATEINNKTNMHAILTRSSDHYVSLRGRLQKARKGDADLFIAIHADAYFNNTATGSSVFALSAHGATSEAAGWLAQQDNYAELDGVEFGALKDRSKMLRSVLIDLAQTTTIRDSIRLGNMVLDALDVIGTMHYAHVEQAPFVVLKSPDIPSILVETGFITNPFEEKRLTSAQYQQKIANALSKGINAYIQRYALLER